MKHLKLKKIRVAKINNLDMILGGNDRQSIVDGCLPDTFTCPVKKTEDCTTTNETTQTLGNGTGGFVETTECGL